MEGFWHKMNFIYKSRVILKYNFLKKRLNKIRLEIFCVFIFESEDDAVALYSLAARSNPNATRCHAPPAPTVTGTNGS